MPCWRRSPRVAGRLGEDARSEVIGQGVAPRGRRPCTPARTSATPAPTRRWSCRHRRRRAAQQRIAPSAASAMTLAETKSAFEAAHRSRFGFIDESKPLVVEAVVGRGDRRRRASSPSRCCRRTGDRCRTPTPPHALLSRAAHGTRRRSIRREQLAPGHAVAGPALVIEPHQTIVVEPGWRASVTAQEPPRARRAPSPLPAPQRDRHRRPIR